MQNKEDIQTYDVTIEPPEEIVKQAKKKKNSGCDEDLDEILLNHIGRIEFNL